MTITFLPQNRRQRRLLVVLLGLLVLVVVFLWYMFLREELPALFEVQPPPPRQVQFDFSVFQHPAFLELGEPRPAIPPLDSEERGKINPFVP